MKEIVIQKNDAGQRTDRFLTKAFPALTQGVIRQGLRKNKIRLNGKIPEADCKLRENDRLKLFYDDETLQGKLRKSFDAPPDIDVVYEDEKILLVNKPAGLPVHEDNDNSQDTLINRILSYLKFGKTFGSSFVPALCNRIDRNTSGIVIAAKTAEALRIISEKIRKSPHTEIRKFYLALVSGTPEPHCATKTAYLTKNARENIVKITEKPTGAKNCKKIITAYKVLRTKGDISLIEVELLTGRTHQIRAHMAFLGHPILGDGKYGGFGRSKNDKMKFQALCSYKVGFDFAETAGELDYLNKRFFTIPVPQQFEDYLGTRQNGENTVTVENDCALSEKEIK